MQTNCIWEVLDVIVDFGLDLIYGIAILCLKQNVHGVVVAVNAKCGLSDVF